MRVLEIGKVKQVWVVKCVKIKLRLSLFVGLQMILSLGPWN